MDLLSSINSPADLKALDSAQLPLLCGEIRDAIINSVSHSGGHLSSNLGTVELSVAIHRVYDTSRDRIVFDVGHQSYAHKILTGRLNQFGTLRKMGGIAGFTKPSESIHDAFIGGHASNSVSAALGMARIRTLRGDDYDVAALIGDGAMTGGLAYEGLSNAGVSGEPLVIILNDNGMSINPNIGGMAHFLAKRRLSPAYLSFKRAFRKIVGKLPPLLHFFYNLKEALKRTILPGTMFDDLGFYYLGPIDGHDVNTLVTSLEWARSLRIPVLLHVTTQKGMGYSIAEDNPDVFHGIGPFDPVTGETKQSSPDFSSVLGETLTSFAAGDKDIVAITAAMSQGTGLETFKERFPNRFFDVGIAEGHAVTMAAGMAKQGAKPVFAVYSSFLQRGYDMLIHDMALQKLHVVLAVDRSGLVGNDGETHHGVFDLAYLSSVPNMVIFSPSSFKEMSEMLEMALFGLDGPAAVRYPRGGEGRFTASTASMPSVVLREGSDITLVGYGIMINEMIRAAKIMSERGYSAEIIKLNLLNPLETKKVIASVAKTGIFLAAEDVCASGCVGERLLAAIAASGTTLNKSKLINLGNGIVTHGDTQELLDLTGLDAQSIAKSALALLGYTEPVKEPIPPREDEENTPDTDPLRSADADSADTATITTVPEHTAEWTVEEVPVGTDEAEADAGDFDWFENLSPDG